jgi:hypothetical protein
MKFYVASSISNKEKVRDLFQSLEQAGHSVAVDWTETDTVPEAQRNTEGDHIRAISRRDLDGVLNCDAFILLSEPPEGRSMYVELGLALAHQVSTGKPRIFVLGTRNDQSVFYYYPAVRRVRNVDEILAAPLDHEAEAYKRLTHEGRLEEFRALRGEMLQLIQDRLWGQATFAVLSAGVLALMGTAAKIESLILVIGLAISFLVHTMNRERARMRMGNYVRAFLEPKIPGMFWEEYLVMWRNKFGKQKRQGWLTPTDRLKHTIGLSGLYLFMGTYCWFVLVMSTLKAVPLAVGGCLWLILLGLYIVFFKSYDDGARELEGLLKLEGRRN